MNQTLSNRSETPWRAPAKALVWRRLLFGAACLATLVALAYAEENWRGRRAWQTHREEWEAKGEKFALAQLVPPPVPEEKNFALCPLLKPVLDLTHGPAGVVWHDTNGMARLNRFAALLSPNGGTNGLLPLGSLEKGTFADPAAWMKVYRGDTNFPAAADLRPAEAVLKAFSKLDPEVRELREAAASRPYSRFPVQYEEEPPFGVLLPHLAKVKVIGTFLEVRATAELVENRPAEAMEDLKLGLRMSESVREEPIVISHLVRMATLGHGLLTVREGLLRHAWTDAQLAEIEAGLGSVNLLAEYKAAMRTERSAEVAELDYLRRNGGWGVNIEDFLGKGSTTCERIFRLAPSGWIYQNMLTLSRICEESTLPAVDERGRRIFPDTSDQGMRLLERRSAPYALFPRLFEAGLAKIIQRCGRMQTFVDATRVACALERYRLANGGWPDNLAALAPKFIDQVPHDLIDGQPLRWHRNADGGYALYSVGWNKTDDGGTPGWNQADDTGFWGMLKEKQGPWVDPAKGDWVWMMPAK
jgi:hypothetical protein